MLHQLPDFLIPYLIQVRALLLMWRLSMQLQGCFACVFCHSVPRYDFRPWTTR